MQAVWKFELPVGGVSDIEMPSGARVLTTQVQHDALCLWALVNPESPVETRRFRIFGTGHEHNESLASLAYVGTAQMLGGSLVWHVFEEEQ